MPKTAPPQEHVIDRVVLIWQEAMLNPKYQMERRDREQGSFSTKIEQLMARLPRNSGSPALTKFGESLKQRLMTPQPNGHYVQQLGVDYDPCSILESAAADARLLTRFPVKTEMYFDVADRVVFKMGYAEPYIFHYAIPTGPDRQGIALGVPDKHGYSWVASKFNGDPEKELDLIIQQRVDFIEPDLSGQ